MEKQRKILNSILGPYSRVGSETLYTCPKCKHHKKKLSVNLSKNVFKCWICDFSGTNLSYLVKRYGTFSQYQAWGAPLLRQKDEKEDKKLFLPKEYVSLCTDEYSKVHLPYLNYLANRGVTEKDIYKWKIGFCYEGRYKNRLIFPSYNLSGDLSYFVARSVSDSAIKYMNPPCSKNVAFNELMVDWDQPVVLVEGIFDAMRFENSIPLLGSTMNKKSELFQKILKNCKTVYIGLDADAKTKENKIIEMLLLYGVEVYKMDPPLDGDYGSLDRASCQQIKEKANFVHNTDYLLYQKIFSEANI